MRGQRGAVLLEVLVSAVVLFAATGATLAVLDGTARSNATSRDRLVAANLAEEDQERMRGLALQTLRSGVPQTTVPAVNGVDYTITSETRAISDSLGFQPTCTSGTDTREDYFLLTSTVRRRDGRMNPPVVVRSLLAPRASTTGYKGSLSVPFSDRNDAPLPGVDASASGPESGATTSNASGCAVFRDLQAGTYSVTYNRTGYVTPTGNADAVTVSGVIVPGQTNFTRTQRYDRAATINGQVRTVNASGTEVAGSALSLSLTSTDADLGPTKVVTVGTAAATLTAANLFPFTAGYAGYAGSCAANNPTEFDLDAQRVTVSPGGTAALPVFAPGLQMKAPSGITIGRAVVTSTDTGCTQRLPVSFSPAAATVLAPVPYGRWSVCVDNGTKRYTKPITLNARGLFTLDFAGTTSVTGTCT